MNLPDRSDAAEALKRRRAATDLDARAELLTLRLGDFESHPAARELQRVAESEIVTLLQLARFDPDSREWRVLARALAEYGYEVFRIWAANGLLHQRAAQHRGGRGVAGLAKLADLEDRRLSEDEAMDLSAELNMVAIDNYRRTFMDPVRSWRPNGGASLKTYYVGRCLMDLPDVYVKWKRDEHGDDHITEVPLLLDRHDPLSEDPARTHALNDHFEQSVPDVRARTMFRLQDDGYTLTEIAEILNADSPMPVTEAAVRSRMTNARNNIKSRSNRS